MKALIDKSIIKGIAAAPPSKSYTIRALMCTAMAQGESRIINPLISDDTQAAAVALEQIGVTIVKEDGFWRVKGNGFHQPEKDLFCRDSAATLRFMTAICALVPGKCRLTMDDSLSKRPVEPLLDALSQIGVVCHRMGRIVIVDGGRLAGGRVDMPGDISSQFVSALLLAAPHSEKGVSIRLTTSPRSLPYLQMTLECLRHFGIKIKVSEVLMLFDIEPQEYKPAEYMVEGDWSSASYLLALGAVGGEVTVTNLNPGSLQADRIMLKLLQQMGADIITQENCITVRKSKLRAITADLSHCIDLLPTMAALAAVAEGESRFDGIGRARLKESDRVMSIKDGLEKMGITVTEKEDSLTISGGKPKGAAIDSFDDHRITMAFSILGAVAGDTIIENAGCVAKTYPDYWQVFEGLSGRVEINV